MTATDTRTRVTHQQWLAEGRRRFGDDFMQWRFICPACGHVQQVLDFKQFGDRGATPDHARQNCIGRFMPREQCHGMGEGQPCDYTAYGLIRLAPIVVVSEDGTEQFSFAFGDALRGEGESGGRD